MFRFQKISPQTLYAHLSKEELTRLGIDLQDETPRTKERIMDMVAKGLENQQEIDMEHPVSVRISVGEEGMKVLATEFEPQEESDMSTDLWDQIVEELTTEEVEIDRTHIFRFQDFEEVLMFVARFSREDAETILTHLYNYEMKYYLSLQFFQAETEKEIQDVLSLVGEFGERDRITIPVLEEYGKKLLEDAAVEELQDHFIN